MNIGASLTRSASLFLKARAALFLHFLLMISACPLAAQAVVDFDKTLGGDDWEEQNAILRLPDGYLLGGNSRSTAGTGEKMSKAHGGYDFWIVRTDFGLHPIWEKTFGGAGEDWLRAMIQTSDGNFLAAGYTNSSASGSVSGLARGMDDFWVIKFTPDGQLIWEKTFGGAGDDECYSILEMPDGSGYLLGGYSSSPTGPDKTGARKGDLDFWLVKIGLDGEKIWDETFGGAGREQFHQMVWASPTEIVMGGGTGSAPNSGDVGPDAARGGVDFWMVRFDVFSREKTWDRRFGGSKEDFAYTVLASKNGGFYIGGSSQSQAAATGCDGCKRTPNYGGRDFWLVKTDDDGKMTQDWSFGGDTLDVLYFLHETHFGHLVLGGVSTSGASGNKMTEGQGGTDFWMIMLQKDGQKRWENAFGGSGDDAMTKILQNPDGSFLLVGHSQSDSSGSKSEDTRGKNDFWLIKTFCDLTVDLLPIDSFKCSGKPQVLRFENSPCEDREIEWSDGGLEETRQILPGTSDVFEILIGDRNACLANDSALVELGFPVHFDLGKDTVIVGETSVTIGVENPAANFHWNTGDTTATISIEKNGIYVLTITEPTGCTARSWARVIFEDKSHVYIPNIFTPNFDGHNDYFFPYCDESVVKILRFRIFDRWGNQVFETHDLAPNYPPDGWDGRFRGERYKVPEKFMFFIELLFDDGYSKIFKGDVLLVR